MVYEFFKTSQIAPRGWILEQLKQQAEGLNGQLDKVWKDVYDSKWLGGMSDGGERLPYFLDGYIPLAYLLRDEDKIARARKYIDCILSCQHDNGCFYPKGEEDEPKDLWSVYLILKVLTVYADCSGDPRIEERIARGLRFLDGFIGCHPPREWSEARWFECLIPVLWLYRRRKEPWLLRLARRLKMYGLDYSVAIGLWDEPRDEWTFETHVVNIAMALKSEALYCELTGERLVGLAERMLDALFAHHGTAYGHFTGDECLSGTSPLQGSELCGIVEAMYSYEWLAALTGDAKWGDFLESLAFNALPAAVSADMWTHQYDQQVNQIACKEFDKPIFRTNGPQANMFGLEPHFGCCTANFGQGWPKLALSAYLQKGDEFVVLSPLPMEIAFRPDNRIVCESEYPFRASFTLRAEKDTPVRIRIPAWTTPVCREEHTISDGWLCLHLPGGKSTEIGFPMKAKLETRPEGRMCLKYGALLFALPVESEKRIREYEKDGVRRKFPYCDYSITPVGEWRYAFASEEFAVREEPYGLPFDRRRAPITISAQFAPVVWDYEKGYDLIACRTAGTVRRGENVRLEMRPYGATDLRVTEMALVK